MDTPPNQAGKITEAIMARVKRRLPDISTDEYNRIYESAYAGLDEALIGRRIVADNDWAFMATVTAMPPGKKRRFYRAVEALFD